MLIKTGPTPTDSDFQQLEREGARYSRLTRRQSDARQTFQTLFTELRKRFQTEEEVLRWLGQFKPVPAELIEALTFISEEDIPSVCHDIGLEYFPITCGIDVQRQQLPNGLFADLLQAAKQGRLKFGQRFCYADRKFVVLEIVWDKETPQRGYFVLTDQSEVAPVPGFAANARLE